jgi:beta-glucosidase
MAKKGEKKTFPKDFLWGASTSAHQVEGGNHNQWTLWEEKTAKKLAESAPKRLRHLPIWPDIEKQATDPANYISGVGIDERFVQLVAKELTDDVDYVITLNEPNVYTSFGYLTKDTSSGTGWPPGEKSFVSFVRVYRNLIRAHRNAYYILKIHKHTLKVGVASQLANIQAKRPHNYLDEFITEIMRYFWNWWFLRQSRKEQDFIGLNYYFTDYYQFPAVRANPNVILNDLGWYMEPEGIYPLLLRIWAHYKKPIMITENGVADMHDQYRRWWLEETIIAMERAMSEGVNIIGYMHWSLLDNFEWASGWWPKFGLIKVDRENGMKRTIRPSAKWFAERINKISS